MESEQEHGRDIETHVQRVRERCLHQVVQACAVANDSVLDQKRSQVDEEEEQKNTSRQTHVARSPNASAFRSYNIVALWTSVTIPSRQQRGIDNMKKETAQQANFQHTDQDIRRHEVGVRVECRTPVTLEQQEITRKMHQQE